VVKWLKCLFFTSLAFSKDLGEDSSASCPSMQCGFEESNGFYCTIYMRLRNRSNEIPARYYAHTTKMARATWREGSVNTEYTVSRSLIADDVQFFTRLKGCAEAEPNRIL
jgi:hypothetical protein